jgi:glycosyltransferase involved in cell wall biosynthesis
VSGIKITVVLSTYNGERYLEEQLDSLRRQSLQPDEVLIRDDCSSDGTVELVRNYIERYGLASFGWKLNVSDLNLGWKRSFYELILIAKGNYIFPCDQDDVWCPEKIETMVGVMEALSGIDLLACSVNPLYEEGSQKVASATDECKGNVDDAFRPFELDARFMYVNRPGCSYCIRRTFVDEIKHYWNQEWPHDAVLWRLAAIKGTLGLLDKQLVTFRRHASNASSRKMTDRRSRLAIARYYIENVEMLQRFAEGSDNSNPNAYKLLCEMGIWLHARADFLDGKQRVRNLLEMTLGRRFYSGWKGFFMDVALGLVPGVHL